MKAMLLILCACGSAPVDPPEDAQTTDARAADVVVPSDTGAFVDSSPDAGSVESGTLPEADPPDVPTSDPNCVEATGCSDLTAKCETGPVWAYGEWALYCDRKTTTIVWTCSDNSKPACATSTFPNGLDKYNHYWCCP